MTHFASLFVVSPAARDKELLKVVLPNKEQPRFEQRAVLAPKRIHYVVNPKITVRGSGGESQESIH